MQIAIGIPNAVPGTPGPDLLDWARRAEAAGFSSLGTIGRIVFDSHEELIALAAAAGVTERIRLATTVMIGPVREPTLLAKQAATLDAVSNGRFTLGLGVGWRDDDFGATGSDFSKRGDELDNQIAQMRAIWRGESGFRVGPPPAQKGGPPILLGGASPRALARVGRLADRFLAMPGPPQQVREHANRVNEAAKQAGRPAPRLMGAAYYALGSAAEAGRECMRRYYAFGGEGFVEAMTKALLTDADAVRRTVDGMREAGVEELFLWPAAGDPAQVEALAEVVEPGR